MNATEAAPGFTATERALLLAVKGVGPRVTERLAQAGYTSLPALASADADDAIRRIAAMVGTMCWRNSPQARRAVVAAISAARSA